MDLRFQIPEPYVTTENRSSVKQRPVLVTSRVLHQNIITYNKLYTPQMHVLKTILTSVMNFPL